MFALFFVPWQAHVQKYGIPRDQSGVMLRVGAADCSQGKDFRTKVVVSEKSRERGLGHRKKAMARDEAMLFFYPKARPLQFWMKDTYIPLAIGFFDAEGKLGLVHEMPVEADPAKPAAIYGSETPAILALETAPGRLKAPASLCAAPVPR